MHSTLNRVYRVIWCKVRLAWVAVSEIGRGHGKVQSSTRRANRAVADAEHAQAENTRALWDDDHMRLVPLMQHLPLGTRRWIAQRIERALLALYTPRTLLASAIASGNALAAPPAPTALPTGGQVSAGQANISQSGANMVIQQSTDRAAINWQTFNVGKDAQVQFKQPSASSVTLNRVLSSDPSQIFGRISANGQVVLTNPAGVYFGKDARVDVGGLIATTHGISDADFMAGNNRFERNGATGSVVNEGELKAALGGYIALLAPEVRNQGAVIAHMGTVALAAGEAIDLKFDANNRLTSIRVEPSQLQALVDNQHAVQAPGGLVIISAQSMDRLVGGVVKNSGAIEATGLQSDGGRIVLSASKTLDNSGTLNVSSATGMGGSVSLQADNITLQDSTRIDATGATGGGTVLVGGNWQGSADPLLQATGQPSQQATTVSMAAGASIDASATQNGDGGKVVLWSDVHNPDSVTTAQGSVLAQGGAQSGNGGQVETSGHSVDTTGLQVSAGAPQGQGGLWLLDPYNYTILDANPINISLNNGTSVTIDTALSSSGGQAGSSGGLGDITVNSTIYKTTGAATTLTFNAANAIRGNGVISSDGNALSVVFNAGGGGGIYLGRISGNVAVTKAGAGTLSLASSGNTYTGGTTLNGGTLGLYSNTALGTGALTMAGGTSLLLGRAVSEIANNITLTGAASIGFDTSLDYLVVGGGGGGGARNGSGGGGGGVQQGSVTSFTGSSISLSVGAGGAGGLGSNSSGGSAGGESTLALSTNVTAGGGSGGSYGIGLAGSSGAPQSNAGAYGGWGNNSYYYGGGGGGAGAANTAGGTARKEGADGLGSWVTGSAYGGGGGGGAIAGNAGLGGAGGGGNGGRDNSVGGTGELGLGGGGGGGGVNGIGGTSKNGGAGGSGTVVVRYLGSAPTNATGGTISYGSGYTYQTFTTTGGSTLNFNTEAKLSGTISGAGALTIDASGGLINVTGNNSYSGTSTLSGGTVSLGNTTSTGTFGAGAITNHATLYLNRTDDFTLPNLISGTGVLIKQQSNKVTLTGNNTYTGGTNINAGTLQVGDGGTNGALGSGAVVDNAVLVFNRSDSLTQTGLIFGDGSLTQAGSGTLTLTQNNQYAKITTISNGTLVLANNAPNPTNKAFTGTGQLRIEPATASTSFTGAFTTSGWTFVSTLTGLTLGKSGNTANITLASATSIAGPISIYGGNIAINAALASTGATDSTALITLKGTGNVTDGPSGYVVAGDQTVPGERTGNLLLLGGNVTLDNIANNDVYTVAASGVSGLTYLDYGGLIINTVGTTSGVSATGVVNIGTQVGSLVVQKDVTTTNASANALTLNASIGSAVGADFSSNILINNTPSYVPTISVGSGGVGKLYTGGTAIDPRRLSILTSLTSGHFRYNADETTNFATGSWTNLSSGIYAIYREQPSASVTVASKSMTYGDALPTLTGSVTGALNGDTGTYAISGRLNSSSGNVKAGSYTLTESGLAGLGYNVTSLSTGTLSVAQKDLTLTGLLAADKTYDRSTVATISSYGSLSGTVSGDTVSLVNTSATHTFADWNAGNNKTVTVGSLSLNGTDSANYSMGTQTTTASILRKALTLTAATDSKVYDGTTASSGTVSYSTLVAGDSISSLSQFFASKNVQGSNGSELKVDSGYTISGDGNGGYNYAVTLVGAQGTITPKALTISGLSSANKVYDGNTTAVVTGPAALQTAYNGDTVGLTGEAIGTFNSKDVASASTVSFSGLSLSGLDAGNYSLTPHAAVSQTITPAALTITANNEAKFVTQSDPTFTVSYSGFVGGETAANAGLTGTLSVTRSGSGPDGNTSGGNTLAGTYTGAITATGLSASNYSVQTVSGNFTIVGSGQLLVRAQTAPTTYGTGASYSITSASYWDTTLNSNTGGEVALTGITPNGNNNFTVADGQTATANFTLAPLNAVNSTAGKLTVGSYQLATSGTVTQNSANFSNNIVVVGAHEVTQKSLAPVVNTGKTKVYDGSAAMSGLSLDTTAAGVLTNDLVAIGSDGGLFADKNVSRDGANVLAANKAYTVSGLSLSGSDAGNYYLATNTLNGTDGQITPKTLTVGYTGVDKVYNGLSTATVNTSDNRVAGDSLSIARTAAFADKNVAYSGSTVIAKTISVTGVSLTGTDALNYDLSGVTTGTTSAKMTPASLVISGIVGVDKIYNNDTTAALNVSGIQETGLVSGDTVTVTATGAFADVNAALGKAVTISSTYGGADKGNYTITDQTGTTASIFKREVMVVASNGVSKTYDGTTDMTGVVIGLGTVNGVTESGVVSGDVVNVSGTGSFSSATVSRDGSGNVLSDKSYTLADLQLSGTNAANYMVVGGATSISGSNGRIDPKTLTLNGFSAQNKVYDGTNTAIIANVGTLTGLVGSDAVTFADTGATFSDQNVATGKTATLYGVTLGGTDAGNYSIASTATTTADITAKTLTIMGLVADNKTYDGTTTASLSNWGAVATGITGEDLTLNHGSAVFDTANAGTSKTVTASGYSLSNGTGGLASNYQLASSNATTTADVAKASLTLNTSSVTKTYDGDTSAAGTAVVTSGMLYTNASNGGVQDSISGGSFAFTDKNAGSGNKTVTVTGVTVYDGNSGGNYNVSYADNTASTINKATLTVTGSSAANKTYDGNTTAAITTGTLSGFVGTETVTATAAGTFDSKDAGSRTATAVYTLTDGDNGGLAGNYQLADTTHSATIDKATLTVTGSSAANKTYDGNTTAAITTGTLSGFVGTETVTATAAGTFDSKDAGNRTATSVYTLTDGSNGGLAGNYQLANTTHAATIDKATLTVTGSSADNKTYDGNTTAVLSGGTLVGVVGTESVTLTQAGNFADKNVGTGKAVTAIDTIGGTDAGNYTLTQPTGLSGNITSKAVSLNLASVSKVYDGQTAYSASSTELQTLSSQLGVAGDSVSTATVQYADKNVGTGKNAALSLVSISDGNGGSNYTVTRGSNSASAITRLSSVTWVGGTSGNWFDPANWAGGAVPDLANVANVVIPSGVIVSFGSTVVAPAESGTVSIDSLGSAGSALSQSAGTLAVGNGGMTLGGYTQSGGTLSNAGSTTLDSFTQSGGSFSGTGAMAIGSLAQTGGTLVASNNLTVTDGFSQGTNGSISVGGNTSITDTSGGVVLGNITSTGGLSVISTDGAISQVAGTAITAQSTSDFTASTGTNPALPADITLANSGNDFVGTVTATGGGTILSDSNGMTVVLNTTGDTTLSSGGNLNVSGTVSGAGSDLSTTTTTSGSSNNFGATTIGGNMSTTTNNGDVTQTGALTVGGTTGLNTGTGSITLNNNGNDFVGTVTATGGNVVLTDANALTVVLNTTGDTTLSSGGNLNVSGTVSGAGSDLSTTTTTSGSSTSFGATAIGGNLSTTTNSGDVTQTGPLTVSGNSTINAGTGSITFNNTANDFNGTVNANGNGISFNDANDLRLGNVTTGGNWTVYAGGNIGQDNTSPNKIVVGGKTSLTAGGSVVLDGKDNKFPNGVTVNARSYTITGDARKAASEAQAKAQSMASSAQPGAASPSSAPPQPLVMTSGTASASSSSSGSGSGSGNTAATSTGNSAGVKIELDDVPAGNATIMAAVSLPKGISVAGAGFSFELPEAIRAQAENKVTSQPTLPSGAPLPAWLKFDAQAMRFEAEAVPDGAFPMQVTLSVGGQRVLVVISERAE